MTVWLRVVKLVMRNKLLINLETQPTWFYEFI